MKTADASFSPAPLVRLLVDARAFAADWAHCDLAANYLAQIVSHDRADSFRYANLLSTVLNELLEIVFSRHRVGERIECTLQRNGLHDRVVLKIPVEPETRGYYERSVEATRAGGLAEAYTRSLLAREPMDQALGLLELASDYSAAVALEASPDGRSVTLTVDVTLEQEAAVEPIS